MERIQGEITSSATDLANYMGCKHAVALDKTHALDELERPYYYNPTLDALKERGRQHEANYLSHLREQDNEGICLEDRTKTADLLQAMEAGPDFIYQARLRREGWRGIADFLIKCDKPSDLGDWSYEVLDAKLARETRGETILQLCVYSEILAELQGLWPEYAYVLTPGILEPEAYRLPEYTAYYRLVKQRYGEFVQNAENADTYPEPVEKCDRCDWFELCNKRRRADDHLGFVAGISQSQRVELKEHGVTTLAQLAQRPVPLEFKPTRGSVESLTHIREQARIQYEARESNERKHELLPLEEDAGLYLLPEPSSGDVYFDIEGARFVDDEGFEYLFGFVMLDEKGEPHYERYLANNPAQEQTIFDQFMQRIDAVRKSIPDMHVYHFHSYEPSALKRLSGRYALHQELLDTLLREERFVDLHRIVRQTLRASVESYSIKELEPFFGYEREIDLRTAGDARHQLESWLEFNNPIDAAPEDQVNLVIDYNKDDCIATWQLRQWLEGIRERFIEAGNEIPRPPLEPEELSEQLSEKLARIRALSEQLRDGLPEVDDEFSDEERARWLLSHLLEFYRREDKATWWEYFRLNDLDDAERFDEKSAIAGLVHVDTVDHSKTGIPTDRYTFPSQELTIKEGDQLHDEGTSWGKVEAIDLANNTIDVRKTKKTAEWHPGSAFSHSRVKPDVLQDSLLNLAERVLAGEPDELAISLLRRDPPTVISTGAPKARSGEISTSQPLSALRNTAKSDQDLAVHAVTRLNNAALPIQGPPGSGKTFTGAHIILVAIDAGKKVGITGPSHKAIRNLLAKTVDLAHQRGETISIIQKGSGDEEAWPMIELGDNDDVLAGLMADAHVGAGTAWLWARAGMRNTVDVLFIDEAGQFSLANTCAVAHATDSLVMLGDPQQLDQPLQGTHPPGIDVSGLQHILGPETTMPADKGLFLPHSWRMHPNICEYISEMFYEGKLTAQENMQKQQLVHPDFPEGAGLWHIPVEHSGNQNASVEEADVVKTLVENLLNGGRWINHEGHETELTTQDILIVTPYNAQVGEISKRLPNARVGTVDKFQGQQAPVVIVSYATSTPEEAPRGMDFLYSLNRLNVAVSRARCGVFLVCAPALIEPECKKPGQMRLANGLARYVERSLEA